MTNPQVFLLPDLGEGLLEADLLSWLVAEGDDIAVDQVVAEVETAKAAVEVPSPYAGTVLKLHGSEGDTLHVGEPLITVGDPNAVSADDDDVGAGNAGDPGTVLSYREEERAGMTISEPEDEGSGNVLIGYGTSTQKPSGRRRRSARRGQAAKETAPNAPATPGAAPKVISPIVRQLAKRHGLGLESITPTGADGVIRRQDVEAALSTPPAAAAQPETRATQPTGSTGEEDSRTGLLISDQVPIKGIRKVIAEHMVASRRTIPDATAWLDIDVTALMEARAQLKAKNPETAPSVLALIARFTVAALKKYPVFNARVDGDTPEGEQITYFDGINLGFAADTDRGLLVPSIARAEQYSARGLNDQIRQLVVKAREGQCTPAELGRGTFTINNYGVFGTDGATAIINSPEVAMLGIGRIIKRPWVVENELAVRDVTELTLSFDHRVADGGEASAFLTMIADAMADPFSALADL